jgi:hypothetical protein
VTYSPAYDTAVTREVAWYTTDPPPAGIYGAWTPQPPALLAANGGAWVNIQAYYPKVLQRQNQIVITRGKPSEERIAIGGEKEWLHRFDVMLLWPLDAEDAETDQQSLDTAIADVLTRIRGPLGDKTHGLAFAAVAEDQYEIQIEYGDVLHQILNDGQLEVHIRYVASDTFPA